MMNLEIVRLENGIDYLIINEQKINGMDYIYLVNTENKDDFVIRKVINDEYVGLNDDEEFENVIRYFLEEMVE